MNALVSEGKLPRNTAGWHALVRECMEHRDPRLLNAILANAPVKTLAITGPVDKHAWSALVEAMPRDFAATKLELQGLSLSKTEGQLLLRVMEGMPELESLSLDRVRVSDGSIGTHPTLSKLTSLKVKGDHTTGTIYPLLKEILKGAQLRTVSFQGLATCMRDREHQALASRLRRQDKLESLRMRKTLPNNPKAFGAYSKFLEHSTLAKLDLSDHGLETARFNLLIQSLQCNKSLTELTLRSWQRLDWSHEPARLDQLVQIPRLSKLDLGYNLNLGRSLIPMFKALEANTQLRRLKLDNVRFNDECCTALTEMLKKNTSLTDIELPVYRFEPGALDAAADAIEASNRLLRFKFFNPYRAPDATYAERAAADKINQRLKFNRGELRRAQSGMALAGMAALMSAIRPQNSWDMPQEIVELLARTALERNGPSAVALASINREAGHSKDDE